MRSIDETFETFGKRVLWLGYAGEEDRSTLIVDLHDILLEFPGATAVLKVRPPDEKAAYPAITETIDDKLHWSIGDSDTAKEGRGELQLSLISPTGSKIKTAVAAMEISRSLPDGGQKPDRIDDWMENAEVARKKAEEAATKANTAASNADTKANLANDAATNNANAATTKANEAATKATDAAKRAEDAAEKADKARQNILIGSETGNPVSVSDAFSAPLCGLTVYGRSIQDGTPTPDAPVPIVSAGDGGSVAVKATGRNLLNIPDGSGTARGVTVAAKDGLISISGTATSSGYAWLNIPPFIASGVVILSSSITSPKVKLVTETWIIILNLGIANKMSDRVTKIVFMVTEGQTYNLTGVKVQVELGTTATEYEPYREQLLTLPTPNGLPGIPVTSGGNYTDENGQQWVCDEVDFGKSVKVQRIDKGAFDATKTLAEQNATLATPIETPLTPDELAAYKALTTYAPNTVVQAADGAGLKLDYQRDVNIVIKNLEDAITSMTTT